MCDELADAQKTILKFLEGFLYSDLSGELTF